MQLCVIGAGPAGLAALRHATAVPNMFDVVALEQTDKIGGTWAYTEATGLDEHGVPIHASMYDTLQTNLPKEAMGFPDFPILTNSEESFLSWNDVLSYLNSYAKHFELQKYIKLKIACDAQFCHRVKKVQRLGSKWRLIATELTGKIDVTFEFDAIIVCNGHFSKPMIPEFKGYSTFPGLILHSHDYRKSDAFVGKQVVVVGEGSSGFDLTGEIARVAGKVYLSREPNKMVSNVNPYPSNVELKLKIAEVKGRKIIFEDESSVEADAILFCTGYEYHYPFLTDDCGIRVVNNRVEGLYKHLICIEHPTLCLVGIPFMICPFPMFDIQVRCFLNTLTRKVQLPSTRDMLEDTLNELGKLKEAGLKDKYFHRFLSNPGQYYDDIAQIGKTEPLPPVINNIHAAVRRNFLANRKTYKDYKYAIVDSRNFIESPLRKC